MTQIENPPMAERLNVFGVFVTLLLEQEGEASGFTVSRLECAPGTGAPLHRHVEREAFYVLEGEIVLLADEQEHPLKRGDFFQVESQVPHLFVNRSEMPTTLLNLSIPAGHAQFFRQADGLTKRNEFTPENAMKVCQANGIEILKA